MTMQRFLSIVAAALLAFGAVSAQAAAGGNGGGHGGGGGAGGAGGGMSGGHANSAAASNSNGLRSADRDKGLTRAADRSDTIADRAGAQPGHDHSFTGHGHSHVTHHMKHHLFGHAL